MENLRTKGEIHMIEASPKDADLKAQFGEGCGCQAIAKNLEVTDFMKTAGRYCEESVQLMLSCWGNTPAPNPFRFNLLKAKSEDQAIADGVSARD